MKGYSPARRRTDPTDGTKGRPGSSALFFGPLRLMLPLLAFCLVLVLVVASRQAAGLAETPQAAQALLSQGRYAEALAAYERLAERPDSSGPVRVALLKVLQLTGKYARVEELASQYLQASPNSAFSFWLGKARGAQGKYAEAEAAFRSAMRSESQNGVGDEAALELALLLKETGRLDESRAEFQRLYEQIAADSAKLGLAAVALQNLEQFQEANSAFRQATETSPEDADIWNAWGRLFLEKYDKANAASVFEDALKAAPNHPDSLAGLAQCLAEEDGQRAQSLVEKALGVNPNLIEAHLLLAQAAIEAEDFDKAADHIQKALQVNPSSPEVHSCKAVLHFGKREPSALQQEIQAALKTNPHCGPLYENLADYAVTQRFYEQAVDYFRKAIELNPRLWSAYSGLGINLLRLGDEAAAKEALEISYANDRFNVWTVNTLRLIDSFENFDTIEVPAGSIGSRSSAQSAPLARRASAQAPDFRIKLHKKESAILRLYVPDLLRQAFETLSAKYAYHPKTPLYLEVFPDHEDFAVRTLGLPGLGALGVCFGPGIVMDSPSARPKGGFHWGSTLWHESAHVITLGMTDHNVPRWFSEGLSVMEEHKARPGWGDNVSLEAIKAMQDKKLLPIAELNAGFQRPRFPGQVQLSYFQAGQACEFIDKQFGFPAILNMLKGFKEGHTLEQVLADTLQLSTEAFDKQFNEFLQSRLGQAFKSVDFELLEDKASLKSPEKLPAWLARHPDSFFANLKLGSFYAEQNQPDRAVPYLQKAKKLFPAYDKPDNPYRQLARIYKAQNKLPAAIAELEALTAINAGDFEALKQLGQWLKESGKPERAMPVLENALYVYPFDPDIHKLLAEIGSSQGKLELALREYRAVLALNPDDPAAAHFNVAHVLFEMGRRSEARQQVLSALEIAPGFQPAQELLLKLSQ
ncbi:MAG: tetratricopeptide repeat protein [Acidobacteriota bacterium]